MIIGYTVFLFKQRERDEKDYLIATLDDFQRAKELFESRVENTITKLTKEEAAIIRCIHEHKTGCTINEIANDVGMSYKQVQRIVFDRKNRDNGGLMEKVKELRREKRVTESTCDVIIKNFSKIRSTKV